MDKITRLYKSRDDIWDLALQNYEESHETWNNDLAPAPMVKTSVTLGGLKLLVLGLLKKYAAGALPPVEVAIGVVGTAETAQDVYGAARDIAKGEEEYEAMMEKIAALDKEIEKAIKELEDCRKQHAGKTSQLPNDYIFVALPTARPDLAKLRASLSRDTRVVGASRDYSGAGAPAQGARPYRQTLKHLESAIAALKEASAQLEAAVGKKAEAGAKPSKIEGDPNETLAPSEREKLAKLAAGPALLRAFDELTTAYTAALAQSEHDESVLKLMRARPNS